MNFSGWGVVPSVVRSLTFVAEAVLALVVSPAVPLILTVKAGAGSSGSFDLIDQHNSENDPHNNECE